MICPPRPRIALALALAPILAQVPGCATAPPPDPAQVKQRVAGPGRIATAAGATLQVPKGFFARRRGRVIELVAPKREVDVFLVEIAAKSCKPAVKAAWKAADPAFAGKVHTHLSPPPRGGYDEIYVESYVPLPGNRLAQAVARRKGELVWVALVRGTPAALDRRAAQIRVFLASMKAPGVKEVDLAKREPRSIVGQKQKLFAFVERLLRATKTPGMALAVVEGDKVALARGFGVREQGKPGAVNADTLMMIGSVSKSLTTLMMAALVDAGKLRWQAKAQQVDPRFKLADSALAADLTVEELVCACAGLPRKDLPLVLEFSAKKPMDVFRELALMRPSTGRRETFQYQNHMVAAGGYVAAHVFAPTLPPGDGYDRAMRQLVFGPLGMRSTTLDHDAALRRPNHALPHALDLEGNHHRVAADHERFARFIRPSGGIWTTANDMARYVITELGRGVAPGGKRAVSARALTHRWKPQVKISAKVSYGLGWMSFVRHGVRVVGHGGGTMGFATWVAMLPDKKLGAVMIANGTGGHLVARMAWKRLMELWFNFDDKASAQARHALSEEARRRRELRQRVGVPEAAWIAPLVGKHVNPEVGQVTVARAPDGKGYLLDAGEYRTRLWRYTRPDGKKTLLFADPPLAGLQLVPLADKSKGTMEMRRAQERYVFQRAGETKKK